ncbi:hypothetical protein DICPUDRAFT_37309 [Dictyostelium purpureum]|uniref:DNA topoisomerase n=1 Tax=Dictyostelium purpureum TaxID=5786 RepID=F0ZSL6_DICPU|nr:uncharacterized protein DICPUDRAFT_37309 [Dictyostelium purpureum]EGC33055.1 hypothetical protein DICPUDRAFT_37309 [Dictyostelium purpureum]|eukprot:XP_003290405.1 hypothetical protein DICPUDRAFT_37309 [Dictyostelium purpureum]
MKILNVAEKPSAAKEIAQILSNKKCRMREGKSQYNKIWDFHLDILNQKGAEMIFTSVTGHLMETDVDERYKPWNSCEPIKLFEVPIRKIVSHDKLNIKQQLETEIKKCDVLILWLDCDREGENIAFEVLQVCNSAKKRFKVYRAIFSAIIPREVNRAIANLKEPNEKDSIAVDTRIEIDLRLGAAFTRFQTLYLKKFQLDQPQPTQQQQQKSIISYGPCQFPTLGFVVERYFRKTNFVREDFWTVNVYDNRRIETNNDDRPSEVVFSWKRKRLFDYSTAYILYEKCLDNPQAVVVDINTNDSKYRPLPLTTIELQKQASKKLRISSSDTMAIAEDLYNKGLISYPRTETDTFQQGTDFRGLIGIQGSHPQWGQYAQRLNNGEFKYPRSGTNNDNSHPPIHPTAACPSTLPDRSKKVYEFITRRFLACCSTESVLGNTSVTIEIEGEQFVETGVMVKEWGYLEVYPYDKRSNKTIPKYRKGERFQVKRIELYNGTTQPPHFLTESELLSAMDKNKIGTDATMATHIQTIQDRGYVIKNQESQFEPTKLGISLVASYELMGFQFSKPELRAQIESDVNEISKGRKQKEEVLRTTIERYKELFEIAFQNTDCFDRSFTQFYQLAEQRTNFHIEKPQLVLCGKCNNKMDFKSDRNQETPKRILSCPTCKDSFDLPVKGEIGALTETDPLFNRTSPKLCPLCSYQVVTVYNQEKDYTYTICPKCRNKPPFPDKQKPFHCFQCTNTDCSLAKGKTTPSTSSNNQNNNNNNNSYRNTNTTATATRGGRFGKTAASTRGGRSSTNTRPVTTSSSRASQRVFSATNKSAPTVKKTNNLNW